jgi:hypothetical protein
METCTVHGSSRIWLHKANSKGCCLYQKEGVFGVSGFLVVKWFCKSLKRNIINVHSVTCWLALMNETLYLKYMYV